MSLNGTVNHPEIAAWPPSATTRLKIASNSMSRALWRFELVKGALELIRADGRKVIAGCGFVVDYLRRNPEFADLTA